MPRYHIKRDGTPGVCYAKSGNCPLGGQGDHYDTAVEAFKAADERNSCYAELTQNNFIVNNETKEMLSKAGVPDNFLNSLQDGAEISLSEYDKLFQEAGNPNVDQKSASQLLYTREMQEEFNALPVKEAVNLIPDKMFNKNKLNVCLSSKNFNSKDGFDSISLDRLKTMTEDMWSEEAFNKNCAGLKAQSLLAYSIQKIGHQYKDKITGKDMVLLSSKS